MTTALALLLTIVILQSLYIVSLQRSHLHPGVKTQQAGRLYLAACSLLRVPGALVAFDVRGMHSLNSELGYSNANRVLSRILGVCSSRRDIVSVWGGDEFVIFMPFSSAETADNLVKRLLAKTRCLSEELPAETRANLAQRTNNIIDGIHLAIAVVDETNNALRAASEAVDKTEHLKEHGAQITGRRETTGNVGTLVGHLGMAK
jgi:GGDEF domain-containing protein